MTQIVYQNLKESQEKPENKLRGYSSEGEDRATTCRELVDLSAPSDPQGSVPLCLWSTPEGQAIKVPFPTYEKLIKWQEWEKRARQGEQKRIETIHQRVCREKQQDYQNFRYLLYHWASWLSSYEWNWFCHFTFRFDTHPESAIKTFRKWEHLLNRKLFGVRYWKDRSKGVWSVLGIERQRRGTIHFHALMRGPGLLMDRNTEGNQQRLSWMEKWNELAGFARIYAYIEPTNLRYSAEQYLTKYVCKGGEVVLSDTMRLVARQ